MTTTEWKSYNFLATCVILTYYLPVWYSKKQSAWGHSVGMKTLGGPAKVKEWDSATNFKALPDKVKHANVLKRFQPKKGK